MSFDVSQAFAKGMAFEEFSEVSGQDIRTVEFDVPRANLECFKQLPDFGDFDPSEETFTMLKPVNGFKDAPRAWRDKLLQVLAQWVSCHHLYVGPELYCVHSRDETEDHDFYQRGL